MKQLIIFFSCIFISARLFAQPQSGSVVLNTDFSIYDINHLEMSTTNTQSQIIQLDDNSMVTFLTGIGVCLNEHNALGLKLGFQFNNSTSSDTAYNYSPYTGNVTSVYQVKQSTALFVMQPFFDTYYFFNDKVGIKNHFLAGVGFGNKTGNDVTVNVFQFEAAYELKFIFLLKKSIGINFSLIGLDYIHERDKYSTLNYYTNQLKLNSLLTSSVSIGLDFYLGGNETKTIK